MFMTMIPMTDDERIKARNLVGASLMMGRIAVFILCALFLTVVYVVAQIYDVSPYLRWTLIALASMGALASGVYYRVLLRRLKALMVEDHKTIVLGVVMRGVDRQEDGRTDYPDVLLDIGNKELRIPVSAIYAADKESFRNRHDFIPGVPCYAEYVGSSRFLLKMRHAQAEDYELFPESAFQIPEGFKDVDAAGYAP